MSSDLGMTLRQAHTPITLTNIQRLSTLYVLPGAAIGDLVWSRDDTTLAIAQEARITLYRLQLTPDSAIVLTDHTEYVARLAFSADGQWLASASHDTTVRLWRLPIPTHHAILPGHTHMAVDVTFHPNSTLVVSAGSWDRTVRVWDIATRTSSVQLLGDTDSVGRSTLNAVERMSAVVQSSAMTDALMTSVAGHPVRGSTMCECRAPPTVNLRRYPPLVATA